MTTVRPGATAVLPSELPPDGSALRIVIGLAGLQFGGCQINAVDLARVLRSGGHDVTLFAVRDDAVVSTIIPYAQRAGFEIEMLDGSGLRRIARGIARISDAHAADVVHVFAPWLNRPVAVASAAWSRRVCIETNWNMENAFWGSPYIPLIVGTGAMVEEASLRRAAAVHLMEPPVDLAADRPDPDAGAAFRVRFGIAPDETLAVIVSRVDRAMKAEGILRTIEAVARLDAPRLTLVVVGDGDALKEVRHAAAAANARLGRAAVRAVGSMEDPRGAYAAADFVLGMGGSAIRALAHGKPLIVLGEGGFSAIYEPDTVAHFRREGFYGIGVDGDPVDRLAALVRELAEDPRRRDELGAFGLDHAMRRFGLEASADALVGIYREALASPPRRSTRFQQAIRLLVRSRLEIMRSRALRRAR